MGVCKLNKISIDPIKEISRLLEENGYKEGLKLSHIVYDESVNENYDYQVIRKSSHDGTLLFTKQLIDTALLALINKQTFCIRDYTEDYLNDNLKDLSYKIGHIRLESEFGTVNGYPGSHETVYIPVVCLYTFK
jgi:hypothetical protein